MFHLEKSNHESFVYRNQNQELYDNLEKKYHNTHQSPSPELHPPSLLTVSAL